jgi:hypothetical protein
MMCHEPEAFEGVPWSKVRGRGWTYCILPGGSPPGPPTIKIGVGGNLSPSVIPFALPGSYPDIGVPGATNDSEFENTGN